MVKNPPANAGDIRHVGSIPGLGRSPGGGNGKPLQYSCLENAMNSMKRQNDRILKEELPKSVGAQYAIGDQTVMSISRDQRVGSLPRDQSGGRCPEIRGWGHCKKTRG